jgi:hypothetical protein
MNHPEHHLQSWLSLYLTSKGILHNASVSAVKVSIGVAMKMKRAGYKAGYPDMTILEPRGPYHGLFIELKYKSRPSEQQIWWRDELLKRGYLAIIMPANLEYKAAQDYLELAVENYMGLK